jgi:hypothetical protein
MMTAAIGCDRKGIDFHGLDIGNPFFGFDRSCAHDWVHRLMPILKTALGKKQALPERKIDSIE